MSLNTLGIIKNRTKIKIPAVFVPPQGYHLTGLRFKNLGTSFTAKQATAIANGDFSEFWNGDYWEDTNQNVIWRIVDNTGIMRRRGDTAFDSPSLVVMPDNPLLSDANTKYMMDSDTTSGGYAGTKYRSTYRSQCRAKFDSFFGSTHIASHRELICNSVSGGVPNNYAWADCDIELPSEVNLFGHNAFGLAKNNIGTNWGRFRLFDLAPYLVVNRYSQYWLRDVASGTWFAFVNEQGVAAAYVAGYKDPNLRPYGIII